jgi:hypothetical protein
MQEEAVKGGRKEAPRPLLRGAAIFALLEAAVVDLSPKVFPPKVADFLVLR